MPSKWDEHIPRIRQWIKDGDTAGQIADALGTTVGNLHKICHRNGISIPRPEAYTKRLPPLDVMADALRAAGYTVTEPNRP